METTTNDRHETAHFGGGAGGTTELLHGDITGEIISAFYAVYNELGYGFVEAVYVRAMAIELFQRRMNVAREVPVTILLQRRDGWDIPRRPAGRRHGGGRGVGR